MFRDIVRLSGGVLLEPTVHIVRAHSNLNRYILPLGVPLDRLPSPQ